MNKIILLIFLCSIAVLYGGPSVVVLPVECTDERISKDNLDGLRQLIEANLTHGGWHLAPENSARRIGKRYSLSSGIPEDYCRICKEEAFDGMILSRVYSNMGTFFLEITMPDKDSGIADSGRRYVMQLTGPLSPDSILPGLGERLLGENKEQPRVALFSTVSMVPTMPYRSYMACDDMLTKAILAHACRVIEKAEPDALLRADGVVCLADLTARQARKLRDELKCAALVQLTLKKYNMQEGRQLSRRAGRRGVSGLPLLLVEIGGEIQVWKGDFERPIVMPFQRIVTSDDVDSCIKNGRVDRNLFGQEALRMGLEQAMRDFRR